MYATNYIRNSKAIGVLWGIFTICYAIIGVVAFVTPEWLGDLEHENPGRFGLWTRCSYGGNGKENRFRNLGKRNFCRFLSFLFFFFYFSDTSTNISMLVYFETKPKEHAFRAVR